MNVLFLSAWYPDEKDPMAGLFVHKHASAVREQGVDVRVLYSSKTNIKWWYEIGKGIHRLHKQKWKPDLIQLNVLDKNGIVALWMKTFHKIPYIIVEHWSGYMDENASFRGGWHGKIMQTIARKAAYILTVSEKLERAMKNCGIENNNWKHIDNVVDDFFYDEHDSDNKDKLRLLHVSCFDEKAKNVKGILRAAKKLSEKRQDWELEFIGNGQDHNADKTYADQLGFPDGMLLWKGEMSPKGVQEEMKQSNGLVLFSNYETYGIVLAEAMATGIPSISTTTCGLVVDEKCGIRITPRDEQSLTDAMEKILDGTCQYNRHEIRSKSERFRSANVGKILKNTYLEILQSH